MKIRNKILIYFSSTVISLTLLSSLIVYLVFAEYREEEFQQRQNEKIKYTIGLIAEYKELSENLSAIMDKHTIHDFYDEKMLIFDKHKNLIYRSIDDLPISNYKNILNQLSPTNQWIETKDDRYDIIGVYIENETNHFYAISKAYDEFGYTKLQFLQTVLIIISIVISVTVILITYFLSGKISRPITSLAEKLNKIDLNTHKTEAISIKTNSFELNYLILKFNQLLDRTNEAFSFQKHAVQHISHELKTPIAILVSELERAEASMDIDEKNKIIKNQIINAKSLADIIHVLLEISKIESGFRLNTAPVRVDEVIFEIIDELTVLHPLFQFEFRFEAEVINENSLTLMGNKMLVKQGILNLMANCISYSADQRAIIVMDSSVKDKLKILFINKGQEIKKEEEVFLFDHFFRGSNSIGISGFGLGLVLTQKIIHLHHGEIIYYSPSAGLNVFEIHFPLR
ncbi:sensor histidine kinase [Anditalea andensis]|uniref:histidine kinase n=1 Tax=Anditalea andensis TaxID=1048983 RepID=A0A074L177_9BACT|nr:HAMP domain-containing sensor histidine kinase [Anditalea andensis]KEO74225.1 hypothetical protein EL17_08815 [Anditalea andensis]